MKPRNPTIVFDIDDTICFPNHDELDSETKYGQAKPNMPVIEKMRYLYEKGYGITLATARRMKTHDGDIIKIIEDIGQITEDWLRRYDVPYDNIQFGKPYGIFYVDDKAMTIDSFLEKEF